MCWECNVIMASNPYRKWDAVQDDVPTAVNRNVSSVAELVFTIAVG